MKLIDYVLSIGTTMAVGLIIGVFITALYYETIRNPIKASQSIERVSGPASPDKAPMSAGTNPGGK